MTENLVRNALLSREVSLGTWIQFGHPGIAEVMANAGFDWIAADAEHTDIGVSEFGAIARGMHGRGAEPFVRVRENDTLAIRQMLDMGARGILVPLVDTAEQAQKAVEAAKYPPSGIRGYCFSRMNDWGAEFDEYAQNANDNVAVVVMIESKKSVENISDILSVDGVDGVFLGPYDMSGSYGIPGQTDAPEVREACDQVVKACEECDKSAGIHLVKPTPETIQQTIDDGFTFIALGVDAVFVDQAARGALQNARSALG
jgi:2-keto-3-deoxy-L-rhamnonate aldolase RhmA